MTQLRLYGSVRNFKCHFRKKSGDIRTGLLSGTSIELDGQPCVIATTIDITEQENAEQAIQQANEAVAKAEAHYRLMFNSVSDALLVHHFGKDGLPTLFQEVNDNACRLLGYTRDELLQMGPFDLDPPEDHPNIRTRAQRLLAERHLIWEGTFVRKDGWRISVEVNTHLVDMGGSQAIISSARDITDRKEVEKEYRHVFDGALEGIFRTSRDGRGLQANPALAAMLGYDSVEQCLSEMNDSTHPVWMNPNERTRYLDLIEKQEIIREYECRLKRRDGSVIWVSLNSRKVCGGDGQFVYTEGFIEDITERKQMQDALSRSEERFAKVFTSSPIAIGLCDLDDALRLIDANNAFEEISGYRREELIGCPLPDLGLWADPQEFAESVKVLQTDGRIRNFEYHFRKKQGGIGVGLMSVEVIELDGRPCALSATIDITKQKQVEDTMRSLVTAIEHSADTIVITDLNGIIQYCNPAFSKVTGYSKEEAIGQNPRVLKSNKHSKEFYEQMWATVTQGNVWTGRLTNKKKDGSFYEEDATISPIRDASGKISGFVAAKRDVTERLQLEDQLRQAQKLESIGRLAGGVAHDFNNLLTVINGYSGFLVKRLRNDDPLREYAVEVKTAGERAASLTKQLLAFSRKQMIEPRAINLNATIRQSAPMFQRMIGEDIALTTCLDESLGQVLADPDQIHQVLMNLIVNARDAMPDGGTLDIETLNMELGSEASADLRPNTLQGRCVRMTVTDSGSGMDEATRQHIFEPFFTTKEVGQGTGLGLATVYGIVTQSGGRIDVSSEVGAGTSFRISFPRIDGSPVPEIERLAALPESGSETILVVEDQKAVRSFAVTALRHCGYHVIEASDGNEALTVAAQQSGRLQLLLTDVVMPGMSGKLLSERLLKLYPKLKVLFTSGYAADAFADRGVLDRGVAFLHKPFTPEEVAAKVREVLDAA